MEFLIPFQLLPDALGKSEEAKVTNLVGLLDGYFKQDSYSTLMY